VAVERREDPERVAVGDALAQFAEIPVLHPLEHERAEDLGSGQALAPRPGAREPAHQIGVDQPDELGVPVEKVGERVQGRLQRDPLVPQFEIGEAERPGLGPHRARRPGHAGVGARSGAPTVGAPSPPRIRRPSWVDMNVSEPIAL
jgi:hypothetical protein